MSNSRVSGTKRKTYDTRLNPRVKKLKKLRAGADKLEKMIQNLEDTIKTFNPALFDNFQVDKELDLTFKKIKSSKKNIGLFSENINNVNEGLRNISKIVEGWTNGLRNLSDENECSICTKLTGKCNRLPRFCKCKQIVCLKCSQKLRECPTCRFFLFEEDHDQNENVPQLLDIAPVIQYIQID